MGHHMLDSWICHAIQFYSVSRRRSAQATRSEEGLALHPCNLPHTLVAQQQTSRDYIMPPNHEAPATMEILVAAGRLIVGGGEAEVLLCISALQYKEESGGTDFGEVAGQGERTSNVTRE